MPPFGEIQDRKTATIKELIFGASQRKKTWWAANACLHNFAVTFIDGDDNLGVLNLIDQKFASRINVIPVVNQPDSPIMPIFAAHFLKQKPFCWDEIAQHEVGSMNIMDLSHPHWWIDPSKLGPHDVIVFDNYTTLATGTGLQAANEKKIDLSDPAQLDKDKRGLFGYSNAFLNWALANIKALNANVIMIAHQDMYEKMGKNAEGKDVVEWSRLQIKSSSGPHAMQVPKYFSDMLYFKVVGDVVKIDTRIEASRDGGSRHVKPGIYKWEELQFVDICKAANVAIPTEYKPSLAFEYHPAGSVPQVLREQAEAAAARSAAKAAVKSAVKTAEKPAVSPATVSVGSQEKPLTVVDGGKKVSGLAAMLTKKQPT